jgi:hypothetical protein
LRNPLSPPLRITRLPEPGPVTTPSENPGNIDPVCISPYPEAPWGCCRSGSTAHPRVLG